MKFFCSLLILILPLAGVTQPLFTLKGAIDTTLKNNFDIQIAARSVKINTINNTAGMAGGLPTVNASLVDNESATTILQKLNSGSEIKSNSATGNTLTSSLTAGILLFNGLRVTATRGRLRDLQKQSELQLNLQIVLLSDNIIVFGHHGCNTILTGSRREWPMMPIIYRH